MIVSKPVRQMFGLTTDEFCVSVYKSYVYIELGAGGRTELRTSVLHLMLTAYLQFTLIHSLSGMRTV